MMFFLLCTFSQSPAPPVAKQPDYSFGRLDTVRADALKHHGNKRPVGENLAKLVEEGVVFTQAWSPAPWTWPAHASLFTGLYPWEHGAHFTEPDEDAIALKPDPLFASTIDPKIPTLAQLLSKGYETISFSANRLISKDFELARGFDVGILTTMTQKSLLELANSSQHAVPTNPYFYLSIRKRVRIHLGFSMTNHG